MENQYITQQEGNINKLEIPNTNKWDEPGYIRENKITNNDLIKNKYDTNKIINEINNFNPEQNIKHEGNS